MCFIFSSHTHTLTHTQTDLDLDPEIDSSESENPSGCEIYYFECDFGQCTPLEKKCDGIPDCEDETDEIDCPAFTGKHTHTRTQRDSMVTHTHTHLLTHSMYTLHIQPSIHPSWSFAGHCLEHEFECDDYCIPHDQLCNGIVNCNDGNDERNCTFCQDDAYL